MVWSLNLGLFKQSLIVSSPCRGAVQAGAICFALFQVCGLIDGYFGNQEMPDQYTARNVTVTLRTIVRGLAYLITFLFGVNCVGLSGISYSQYWSGKELYFTLRSCGKTNSKTGLILDLRNRVQGKENAANSASKRLCIFNLMGCISLYRWSSVSCRPCNSAPFLPR